MRYRTGSTGQRATRELDPYRVWYRSGGLYVVGLDHHSGEIRTFAVDRIRRLAPTARRFTVPASFDFDAYIGASFGVIAEPAVPVRIRFDRRWAAYVSETAGTRASSSQPGPAAASSSRCRWGPAELRGWVLSFGAGAEVLEPPALRDEVEELAAPRTPDGVRAHEPAARPPRPSSPSSASFVPAVPRRVRSVIVRGCAGSAPPCACR